MSASFSANDTIKAFRNNLFLRGRGEGSISTIAKAFKLNDTDKNGVFSFDEFVKILGRCGVFLPHAELKTLFRKFDEDNSGTIDYNEFLKGVAGELNERREAIVKKCYKKLDKTGDGKVDIDDVRGTYDASQHPKVKSGEMTVDDVFRMMLTAFEGMVLDDNGQTKSGDGIVSWEEFKSYMKGVSASIPNDDNYFCKMIELCWHIQEDVRKGLSDDEFEKLRVLLREKVTAKTAFGGSETKTLRDLFRYFDADNSGRINFFEFKSAIARVGITLDDAKAQGLFDAFDTSKSGKIDYKEFTATLFADA